MGVRFQRRLRSPLEKPCSGCGTRARFGHSAHAEAALDALDPLRATCLKPRLVADYSSFAGEALVVQPAAGLPVYVFQPLATWRQHFNHAEMLKDVESLLRRMDEQCHDCGGTPKFVWVESQGLTADTCGEVLDRGISATLLQHNPAPISLCAECCVERIAHELTARDLSFLEVCSPTGAAAGFVLPMGY